MTRGELIENAALKVAERRGWDAADKQLISETNLIADTIFAALKEPTLAMYKSAHGHYEGEVYLPHGLWQAMLAASPLAPEGGRD